MTIIYSDRAYWRSHGKAPKGRGYWGFEFEGYTFWAAGTLSEAKKACKAEVNRLAPEGYTGIVTVKILP